MKRKKTLFRAIIGFLLILSVIGFVKHPVTYSKFSNGNDNALVYNSKLYNLYHEYPLTLENATNDTARFYFSFKINDAIGSNETDKYEIIIPNNCVFDDLKTSGQAPAIDKNIHTITISFDKGVNKNYINSVRMTCSIVPKADVNISVKINETIDKESFSYIRFFYESTYQDYLDDISKIDITKTLTVDDNLYSKFVELLTNYAASTGYRDIVLSHVLKYENNADGNRAFIDDLKNNRYAPLGISIKANDNKTEYTFEIKDSLVGYARTSVYGNNGEDSLLLYFSTKSKSEINEMFSNYLNLYVYPNIGNLSPLIENYVNNNGGIYSVLYENKTIPGLEFDSKNGRIRLRKQLILSYATSYNEGSLQIVNTDSTMMNSIFWNMLTTNYSSISNSNLTGIYNLAKNSITKNNTANAQSSFKDYLTYSSGTDCWLIEVASGITGYTTFNVVKLPFAIPNGMSVTAENINASQVAINIKHTSEASVMNIANSLSNYFNQPIVNNNNFKVISTDANNYTVQYIVTK